MKWGLVGLIAVVLAVVLLASAVYMMTYVVSGCPCVYVEGELKEVSASAHEARFTIHLRVPHEVHKRGYITILLNLSSADYYLHYNSSQNKWVYEDENVKMEALINGTSNSTVKSGDSLEVHLHGASFHSGDRVSLLITAYARSISATVNLSQTMG